MKPTHITGAVLAGLSLLVAPACASHHPGAIHTHGREAGYGAAHDPAYDRGYHDGLNAGVKDWKRDHPFDIWRHDRYRSADSGYRWRFGPRPDYRRAYRAGFRAGYELGYGPPRGRRPLGDRRSRPRY